MMHFLSNESSEDCRTGHLAVDRYAAGFTLLELLCALLLLSTLLCLSFPVIRLLGHMAAEDARKETAKLQLTIARQEILRGLSRGRAVYGFSGVEILSPQVAGSMTRKAIDSPAILVTEVQSHAPAHVLRWEARTTAMLCGENRAALEELRSTETFRSALAISVTGTAELPVRGIRKLPDDEECKLGTAYRVQFREPYPYGPPVTILPIVDRYILYSTSAGLRRRSLLTGEDQPIAQMVTLAAARVDSKRSHELFTVTVRRVIDGRKVPLEETVRFAIPRRDPTFYLSWL